LFSGGTKKSAGRRFLIVLALEKMVGSRYLKSRKPCKNPVDAFLKSRKWGHQIWCVFLSFGFAKASPLEG
jgi:hypothetical protein